MRQGEAVFEAWIALALSRDPLHSQGIQKFRLHSWGPQPHHDTIHPAIGSKPSKATAQDR
jgi:hypothetical protein